MTHAIDNRDRTFSRNKQFQKFVFIGNTSTESPLDLTKQLHLTPNSSFLSHIGVGSSLTITQIHTPRNITRQLRNLQLKPGKTVQLVSKTSNGSVVISSNNRLIGMGVEIAQKIIVTLAGTTKQ